MTREEAIRIFRKEIECLSHTKCEDCILEKACDPMNTTPYDSEYIEAYSMAIKALEQEPQTFKWCTDCKEYDQEKHCCHRWSKVIRDTVEEMKQEPKTGHWIFVGEENEEETRNGNFRYICSECGYSDVHAKSTEVPYCWHCGAKMVEPQESEG